MNSDTDRTQPAPSRSAAWSALTPLAGALPRLNELFAADPGRAQRMTVTGPGCALDFSKQRITTEALQGLLALADACDLRGAIRQLFAGERVNLTEGRAALHMALRAPPEAGFSVDGEPVGDAVESVLQERAVRVVPLWEHAVRMVMDVRAPEVLSTVVLKGLGGAAGSKFCS